MSFQVVDANRASAASSFDAALRVLPVPFPRAIPATQNPTGVEAIIPSGVETKSPTCFYHHNTATQQWARRQALADVRCQQWADGLGKG